MAGGWQLGDSPSWLNSPRLVKGTHCYPGILFFCFFSATLRLGKVLIGASKRENMRWLQVHEDWWKWDVFFLPWPMANPLPKVLTQLDHRMWLKNLDNPNSLFIYPIQRQGNTRKSHSFGGFLVRDQQLLWTSPGNLLRSQSWVFVSHADALMTSKKPPN